MDKISEQTNFLALKENGNEAFKKGDLSSSLTFYELALKFAKDDREKATIMKNLSAVHLKLGNYDKVIENADYVLNTLPKDPKALYRKCLALEQLDKIGEAYQVVKQLLTVDPSSGETLSLLQRLYEKVQRRIKHNNINTRVEAMCEFAFDRAEHVEKREKALNNILTLISKSSSSEILYRSGVIFTAIRTERHDSLYVLYIKIIAELCKGHEQRADEILSLRDVSWFLELMNRKDASLVSVGQYCLQTILHSLAGLDDRNPDAKSDPDACNRNKRRIEEIFTGLIFACNSHAISGLMRDAVIKLLTRNVHRECLNWAVKFVELKGLQRLMEVACEMPEYKHESSMELTDSTKTLVSICLACIYENMHCDKDRSEYLGGINEFVEDLLLTPDSKSKVRVTVAITILLQGPLDIGHKMMVREGVLDMILIMAGCDDLMQQTVASECIVSGITEHEKGQAVAFKSIHTLNKLYTSQRDSIRARALVGLCKVSSICRTCDFIRPLLEDTNENLAAVCRKFLIESEDVDAKFRAIEGLSFLTVDTEVKEILIQDLPAINALIDAAKRGNMSSAYAIVTTFMNLLNAHVLEMTQLAKFVESAQIAELARSAESHISKTHPYDTYYYIIKRTLFLGRNGAPSALVAISGTESHRCKELISTVFNVFCKHEELCSLIIQQGGIKALLELSQDGTLNGRRQAAQALARIGSGIDVQIAFPGKLCIEVIRPLLILLQPGCDEMLNFEALLAICDIASIGDTTRSRILKEIGFEKISSYLYTGHLLLRRAAMHCVAKFINHPDVVKLFEAENHRFKFLVLLSWDNVDEATMKSAAGAVAVLTEASDKCCNKLFTIKRWAEILRRLLVNSDQEMQRRYLLVVLNVMASSKTNAEKVMNSEIGTALREISVIPGDESDTVRDLASQYVEIKEQFDKEIANNTSSDEE